MRPDVNSPEFKKAISVARMRESDMYTIESGVPGRELMKRAALGIYNAADWTGEKVAVICGSGNNGGDGYALAEILSEKGTDVSVFRVSDRFSDDGRYYYERAVARGAPDFAFDKNVDLTPFDIIVDCILGTGFRGEPEGIVRAAIEKINSTDAYVISADINSGLNGDTGEASIAVRSDLTVSIGYFKTGMFLNSAPDFIGDLVNVDIGIELV